MLTDAKTEAARSFAASLIWAQLPSTGTKLAAAFDVGNFSDADIASLLSADEVDKAKLVTDATERRHFMFRRGFQRIFMQQVLKLDGPLDQISIVHQRDCRPRCLNAPDCHLSFSSSGTVALACASSYQFTGVDIEKIRAIENVVALAHRFFSASESDAIAALPPKAQSLAFLQHWTAKEAALKAIGKGIAFGLNTFELAPAQNGYALHRKQEFADSESWKLHYVALLPEYVVAVVHRPVD